MRADPSRPAPARGTTSQPGEPGEARKTLGQLLAIGLPLMAGHLVETLYNITDTYFLGRLGAAELSAPSVAFPLVMGTVVFGMGIANAGTTLIAQSKGRRDPERMNYYLGQTASLLLIIALLLAAGGALASGPLLRLLQTPGSIYPLALVYLRTIFAGVPLMFGFFLLRAAMQGTGNTKVALAVQLATVAVNIPLDVLLIFGAGPIPALSVQGAALATVISRGIGSGAAFFILFRGNRGLILRGEYLRPRRAAFRLLLRIGLPASTGQGLSALGFTVLQGLVNIYGTAVIAAFGVGNRIIALFNMPAMGLGKAVTSLVGRELGAGDQRGARRAVAVAAAVVTAVLLPSMLGVALFGGRLMIFFVDDPEAAAWGALMFRVVTPSVVLFAYFLLLNGAFQGAGDTRPVMLMNAGRLWLIRVPLAYLFSLGLGMGPLGIWVAMFISNFLTALAGYLYYRRGGWMTVLGRDDF